MPHVRSNGIDLAYEASGPADGAPLLLIHGVGAQLVRWPDAFVDGLAAAGFRVVRFDNRDVGLSSYLPDAGIPDLPAILAARARGEAPALPYTIADMAADAAGLLDALGIGAAHVVGVSMGGMIAQQLAIDHGARVASLTIVMSSTGHPDLPGSDPAALGILSAPPPDPAQDRAGFLAHSVALNTALGSPGYPADRATLEASATRSVERAHHPAGAARHLAASRGSPERRTALAGVAAPTLVIHGRADPLVPAAAGEDVARAVPGSWLLLIDGMGHDLPAALCPLFVATIGANADRAR